jgi:transketolase
MAPMNVRAPIDQTCIDTIRTLSMDAVQQANSGHPGTPMALAPVAYTLWQDFLRYDPDDALWPNRDRFVLSVGHASMLLYSMLHLTGVKAVDEHGQPLGTPSLSIDDLKRFRQLGSKTPGHPEYHMTTGVETTTGPLGQGCGNSVGMAMAGRWLAAHFNKPDFTLFDFDVYTLCGDGDMMEGVSSEAASLAGFLGLSNLCWIYDSNTISIEGHTDITFTEDVAARFRAYGWNVLTVADANDTDALRAALEDFRRTDDRPTFILVHSVIGYGAPHKQNTKEAHGEPLGVEEVKLAKAFYGWPEDAQFLVPDGVYARFQEGVGARGRGLRGAWVQRLAAYREQYPEQADQLERMRNRALPDGWDAELPSFPADAKGVASRESSGKVLNAIAARHPWLLGGSADLAPSTKTLLAGEHSLTHAEPGARNLHFGVREHGMGAVLNGMALTYLRPYGAGFFIFTDYMRPPMRLAAIMELPVVYIMTHDSIGVGEDGPTHQPVEQLAGLRAMPGMVVIRPADANEVVEAWKVTMNLTHAPVCLVLSRQALPTFDRTVYAPAAGLARGAYVMADADDGAPDVILIGTGSEVSLCIAARDTLAKEGIAARVVSMPSWTLFEQQEQSYRDSVLPPGIRARVSVEQAATMGWDRYVGFDGAKIGMHPFGASAPIKDLLGKFGFTADNVCEAARAQVAAARARRSSNGTAS